jgi:pimeloyl-ACP methyl ester carboxylesterase
MRERTLLFGNGNALLGITSEPVAGDGDRNQPAVILLNAGLVHRVGPNRISVKIARHLAASGYLVLRFDFSGIGDSGPRTDGITLKERAIREVQEAMDAISSRRGIDRFILLGLCSGADDSVRVACRDSRVVGCVLIDVSYVFSAGYQIHSYAKRLFRFRSWMSMLLGRSDFWGRVKQRFLSPFSKQRSEASEDWPVLDDAELVEALHSLSERGLRTCLLYSDDSPAYYNYRFKTRKRLVSLQQQGC